jgi:hypothetical protein
VFLLEYSVFPFVADGAVAPLHSQIHFPQRRVVDNIGHAAFMPDGALFDDVGAIGDGGSEVQVLLG